MAVEGLCKRYGGRPAVSDVSFVVAAGTVVALLGPNGAGKTTTVECVAGFRAPDAGRVRVRGVDPLADRPAVTAQLGVMLQEGGAYQSATPLEMLRLYARLYPQALDVPALLERVGLAPAAGVRYRALSRGQKQRVNLALALVGRPSVAVLDEPTSGLDPQARHDTWALIRELRDDGVAVLLTTHALDEAERLADTLAVIAAGRLRALASPAALSAAGGGPRLAVATEAPLDALDARALAAHVGATVRADGAGRWLVHAGPEAIPAVTEWFAARALPLSAIGPADSLEDAYLRLVAGDDGT